MLAPLLGQRALRFGIPLHAFCRTVRLLGHTGGNE